MASINLIVPTTELEAVNKMLAAIGESPVTVVDGNTQLDVQMAVAALRGATRDLQNEKWRFNTEFGYELAPSATYVWTDTAGVSTTLNIFRPPTPSATQPALVSFSVSKSPKQQGSTYSDVTIRPSRKYLVAAASVLVFYDRENNRDGFPLADRPYLYIDPVWMFDFEQMPTSARRVAMIRAAREFIQSTVGSREVDGFKAEDEFKALRLLKREQGMTDDLNMLNHYDVSRTLGRTRRTGGVYDPRSNAGHS